MSKMDIKYFKEYRGKLGFSNQSTVKKFFGAKDIVPTIDYNYINILNSRLVDIVKKIDNVVISQIRSKNLDSLIENNIFKVFEGLKKNDIISTLNNQGRRVEEVYFSWMRGFVISKYFIKAISVIFAVKEEEIKFVGDDDISSKEAFKRSHKADLEILVNGQKFRIEIQSGFQGVNDIKQKKILEAQKNKTDFISFVIHFDIFNGQVAFVRSDSIEEGDKHWITRTQMEGQTVFNIDQNYFLWKLVETPPLISDILEVS